MEFILYVLDKISLETVISVLIGALITWFVSLLYYKKAGRDLSREAAELKRLNKIMLLGMEHNNWLKLSKDKEGNILGFEQSITAPSIPKTTAFGSAIITQGAREE